MVKTSTNQENNLADLLKKAIARVVKQVVGKTITVEEIHLEHPENEVFGDYSSNIGLQVKGPKELVKVIKKGLEKEKIDFIEKVEIINNFINIWIKNEWLISQVEEVLKNKNSYSYGKNKNLQGKKLMVEYAHPNTHKEFHIGHLRNICIGESLSRILEANGAKVIRTNYQGDVGLHVAKAIYGVKLELQESGRNLEEISKLSPSEKARFLGKAYSKGAQAYEKDEKAKIEVMKLNKQIYQNDPKVKKLWQTTRQWSLDYFAEIYQRLGTKYDRLYLESDVSDPGTKNAQSLLKKGILTKSKGAVVFSGDKYGIDTRVFLTREGLPTYEAKELGLAPLEFSEFGQLDKCIHVVAPEQTSFFKVTFKVEELWDPKKYEGKQYHLRYGFVDLKEGKMSSRKGQIIAGMDVVDQAKDKIKKIMSKSELENVEAVAEKIAVGAVKYSLLKQSVGKNIQFDIEESVSLEGNSGPYLQYTYARAQSVLKKAKEKKVEISPEKGQKVKLNAEELAILRWLYRFPEVVLQAGQENAPNVICNFLYELAQRFNTFYNQHKIIGSQNEARRLQLTAATAQVLENGLRLLGIKAPEKM